MKFFCSFDRYRSIKASKGVKIKNTNRKVVKPAR